MEFWKLRCEQLEEQLKRAKEDSLKWRRANKQNLERVNEAYQSWEKSELELMDKIDKIANPINTFEQAQAAALEVVNYLRKQNGL